MRQKHESIRSIGIVALLAVVAAGCTSSHSKEPKISAAPAQPIIVGDPNPLESQQPAPSSILANQVARENARRQEIGYQFDSALKEAEHFTVSIANLTKPVRTEEIEGVQRTLALANAARDIDPTLFTQDEREAMTVRLKNATVAATTALERRRSSEVAQSNREARQRIIDQQRNEEQDRQRQIEILTEVLKQLVQA